MMNGIKGVHGSCVQCNIRAARHNGQHRHDILLTGMVARSSYLFLCLFFRSLFFLLCLAIFARLRFFPLGILFRL